MTRKNNLPEKTTAVPGPTNPPNGLMINRQQIEIYFGPIPHPSIIEGYERIYPGAAAIIFDQLQKQSDHRRQLEKIKITSDAESNPRGTYCGLAIGLASIAATCFMTYMGHPWPATVFGTGGIASLVGVFIYGKQIQMHDLQAKKAKFEASEKPPANI